MARPVSYGYNTCMKIYSCCQWVNVWLLTYWGRDKMAAIFQTKFSNAFSWMKMYEFRLRFHWSLFPRFKLTIFHHWFWWWLGADQATSHYLNQWWFVYWRIYASLGSNELKYRKCHMVSDNLKHLGDRVHPYLKWQLQYQERYAMCSPPSHIVLFR